ncbi:MAG: leucine-rich repeat domain-containing protein [Saprospiraceae bacterium]|nr:leucine-rich repeat domain-containing protein [Saprospiraceae bacterium]
MNTIEWWNALEDQWKRAYNIGYFGRPDTLEAPVEKDLLQLLSTPVLRLVGPRGPNPTIPFELTNCSGINGLENITHLFLLHNAIDSLAGLENANQLISLFVNDNKIESLEPISGLVNLEALYINNNSIQSLEGLSDLTHLKTLNCCFNKITSLEGIHEGHRENLRDFFVTPNDISFGSIREFEDTVQIQVKKG